MTGVWIEERNTHRYLCGLGNVSTDDKHVVTATGAGVDEVVTEAVLARYATVKTEDVAAPEFEGDARLAEVRKMLAELEAEYMAGNVPAARYYRMSNKLDDERDELVVAREEFIHATVGPPVAPVTPEMWAKMSMGERRAKIERLVEAVIIKPGSRAAGPKFDKDRVAIVWR